MKRMLLLIGLVGWTIPASATLVSREWVVDGVKREALVSVPAGAAAGAPLPVVFAFHGHGGSMRQASRSFPIHEAWPGAIVVYPQGLPTPSRLVDHDGSRAGWQGAAGDQGDRDLRFFDVMLASLRADYHVDNKRVYATGHSNGGLFTDLLWAERGDTFAAIAPSAALLTRGHEKFRPKPVLHLASPEDPLVKFAWQAKMIDYVLKLNGCGPRQPDTLGYRSYASAQGAEVATFLHAGGHGYSPEGPQLVVKFFHEHPQP